MSERLAFGRITSLFLAVGLILGTGCTRTPVASEEDDWHREDVSGANLYDVWGTTNEDVFAVGEGGIIVHYDGSRWTQMVSGVTSDLNAVFGRSPQDVYAAGRSGVVLHYDGSTWTSLSNISLGIVYDVWTAPGKPLYVTGQAGVWVYEGDGWRYLPGGLIGHSLRGFVGRIHPAVPEEDFQLIAISGSTLCLLSREGWECGYLSIDKAVRGFWGVSSGELFMVCREGLIYHSHGGSFETSRPVQTHLYSVNGLSTKNVYAVGSSGRIVHYDGQNWKELPTAATNTLAGVWVAPGGDVFVVGYAGTILHYSP